MIDKKNSPLSASPKTMDHPPPAELPRQQRDDLARRHVASAEEWLRRIVHHQLHAKYGSDYVLKEPLIDEQIKNYYKKQISRRPGKLPRDIDVTTFAQVISIVTEQELYEEHFSKALRRAYPLGREEARNFLNKLKDIRNNVSHGHGCSARQLEQAICYSNDLIDSIKEYFKDYFKSIGMKNLYNAPTIVRVHDNLGNESHLESSSSDTPWRDINWREQGGRDLFPGDTLVVEIEVDQSFDENTYEIKWSIGFIGDFGDKTGNRAEIRIANEHIRECFIVNFQVICKRDWHRWRSYDDEVHLVYRVLPPPNE